MIGLASPARSVRRASISSEDRATIGAKGQCSCAHWCAAIFPSLPELLATSVEKSEVVFASLLARIGLPISGPAKPIRTINFATSGRVAPGVATSPYHTTVAYIAVRPCGGSTARDLDLRGLAANDLAMQFRTGMPRVTNQRCLSCARACREKQNQYLFFMEVPMCVSLKDEVCGADFGDKRLNKRLAKVVEELGNKPNMSVPAATHGRAEMEAAYRFFDNDKVTPEKILQPHIDATRERISQTDVALLVQDTTELDLTRPTQQVAGVGPIECDSRHGAFFHPLVAFDAYGVPLGVAWQKNWAREKIERKLTQKERRSRRRKIPIEEKESIRWVEGIRSAREVADACPQTTCVCIADSEADIYEMFSETRTTTDGQFHLLIRACQERSLVDGSGNWLQTVRAVPCRYKCSVNVSGRKPKVTSDTRKRRDYRVARIAEVEVRATTVTLRPPRRHDRKLPEVTINVVLVEETDPPEGDTPVQWLLVTSLPIAELEQVRRIVSYYCIRWQIEIYFRTIKSGCRIESRQFEKLCRLLNCLSVYSIVAWKIMYLCRLGRECPDLNCEVVFESSEWKSVFVTVRNEEPPSTPPTLNQMIRMIANLGGYVDRKSTQPGPQTLWYGLQRVHDLSTAWEAFGPDNPSFFRPPLV